MQRSNTKAECGVGGLQLHICWKLHCTTSCMEKLLSCLADNINFQMVNTAIGEATILDQILTRIPGKRNTRNLRRKSLYYSLVQIQQQRNDEKNEVSI